jgi:hypothetical protein
MVRTTTTDGDTEVTRRVALDPVVFRADTRTPERRGGDWRRDLP